MASAKASASSLHDPRETTGNRRITLITERCDRGELRVPTVLIVA